jgi:hypothetical protein
MIRLFLMLLLLLTACSMEEPSASFMHRIKGRLSKEDLYQTQVPEDWKLQPDSADRNDTRNPLASWKKGSVVITFHNFSPDMAIPPGAQVQRWKNQMKNAVEEETLPTAHGGFGGFRWEAYGNDQGVIAYAMQMNQTLKQKLRSEGRADWTLKAVGPSDELEAMRDEIDAVANRLELIEPIR